MKSKSFLKETFIYIFVGIFINLFCFFIYFFPSHAESVYFPMEQNYNGFFSENDKLFFENTFDSENNYIFVHYYLHTRFKKCHVLVFSKESSGLICGEFNNNGYQFSLYKIGNFPSTCYDYQYDSGNDTWFLSATISGNGLNQFVNVDSNLYSTSIDYISNFVLYTNNTDNSDIVLSYSSGEEESIGLGHATAPDPFDDPVVNSGSDHTLPHEVPESPSINNYTWNIYNPPAIDTTNLESLIESLIFVVNYLAGWLRDNLAGEFSNLITNLSSLIQYIVVTIQYYGGLIISNIQNGITNFYNNMVSLFEPFINHFSEPLDSEEVMDSVEDTTIYSLFSSASSFYNSYSDFFDDIQAVSTLSFSVPYTILTKSGYIIIDFTWYSGVRDSIVPWIVGFLYAGFGLSIFRSIPSIIHGLSGVLQKGA